MADSPVAICNMALISIGGAIIISLSEDTVSARICNSHYDDSLKATLAAVPWTFATKRGSLAVLTDAPVFGFINQYSLPADYLHMQEVYAADGITTLDVPWKIEDGKILTDQAAPLLIRYTYFNESTPAYTPLFVDALVARLTADMAMGITRLLPLRKQFLEEFGDKVSIAGSIDNQQGSDDALVSDMLTDVR